MIAKGDAGLMKIVFNNLCDNALSHANPDTDLRIQGRITTGRIEVNFSNQADDLPDNLERLFEPLFRRETSGNDRGSHLGIGLTLSLEAATAMGATLQASKTDAGWIEFTFATPSH